MARIMISVTLPPPPLHLAARDGSTERILTLLSTASIGDIDQGDSEGNTPLIIAAQGGYSPVVRILLGRGANFSIRGKQGLTALHRASLSGHLSVTIDLLHAGAAIEARTDLGATPLHLAAEFGYPEVMKAFFNAGANIDCRSAKGATPLFLAAAFGHLNAVQELLRVGADPVLASMEGKAFGEIVPLDMAAHEGYAEVVRELIQQLGVRGCGGPSGGVDALALAAAKRHIDIMGMLSDAGVVDTASALVNAVLWGRVDSVDFLLQQKAKHEAARYVNTPAAAERCGFTALMASINPSKDGCSTRMVRKLIDAGADTAATFRFMATQGGQEYLGTVLDATNLILREGTVAREVVTENYMLQVEAIGHLLQQVHAIHATSWLWCNGAPMPPVVVLPMPISWARRRRRAGRHGMLLPRLFW